MQGCLVDINPLAGRGIIISWFPFYLLGLQDGWLKEKRIETVRRDFLLVEQRLTRPGLPCLKREKLQKMEGVDKTERHSWASLLVLGQLHVHSKGKKQKLLASLMLCLHFGQGLIFNQFIKVYLLSWQFEQLFNFRFLCLNFCLLISFIEPVNVIRYVISFFCIQELWLSILVVKYATTRASTQPFTKRS